MGLILTTRIITAPPMAAAFFNGTMGHFSYASAFQNYGASANGRPPGSPGHVPVHPSAAANLGREVNTSSVAAGPPWVVVAGNRFRSKRGRAWYSDTGWLLTEMSMSSVRLMCVCVLLASVCFDARSQSCASGVPVGGNPSCIPPSVPGSPYYVPPQGASEPDSGPAGRWLDTWGAITIDMETLTVGASTNRLDEKAAISSAVQDCKGAGGRACKVAIRYYNQCAALAWPMRRAPPVTARAATESEAASLALTECSKSKAECKVIYSACSPATFQRF